MAAKEIEHEDPYSSCQILLASAVYQNSAGQNVMALETIGWVLDLAKRTCFTSGALWAHWAGCAICFQQKNLERAAQHLDELEAVFTEQNEWVLADFVNVIKQTLCQPEWPTAGRQPVKLDGPDTNGLYDFAGLWLQNWGLGFQTPGADRGSKWSNWEAPDFFHNWKKKLKDPTDGGESFLSGRLCAACFDYNSMPESLNHIPEEVIFNKQ